MFSNKKTTLRNPHGLSVEFLGNGSIRSIEADPIRISLKVATPFSKSGANVYLRKRTTPFEYKALSGPESNSRFTISDGAYITSGSWEGLKYSCVLQLSKTSLSWQWRIEINNTSDNDVELDLIYVQDVGLKPISDGLVNEYYVSQYLERRILESKNHGSVICCRQNMKESVGNPWLMLACKGTAASASVDGMQFYGSAFRETNIAEGLLAHTLGGEYSGESSIVALQEKQFHLAVGDHHQSVFVATYLPDHPKATSEDDMNQLDHLFLEFGDEVSTKNEHEFFIPDTNIFNTSVLLPVDDLNEEELARFFGNNWRHLEEENGRLLSFFNEQNNHVILRAKEIMVDRPHAHIMQAKAGYAPDENIVSTTAYAYGVFNSHLTQGNTNFNIFLSVSSSQFNLTPEMGQRIFIEINGIRYLLGVPSAFEIGLNHCRWIYKQGDHCFQVRSWTSKTAPQVNMDVKVISGKNVKLLITHHFDYLNGWTVIPGETTGEFVAKPKPDSMIAGKFPLAQFRMVVQSDQSDYKACGDELLYLDHHSRGDTFFVLDVQETSHFCMSFIGEVCSATSLVNIENADDQWFSDCRDAQSVWQDLCLNLALKGDQNDTAAIQEILPWYGMNALTHFLTPHGLEQFSGAAWGTRDIAQGPFDLLLCMEKYDEARQVLCIIFSNQNTDGGWPQWWMFDSYSNIRADSSHGDVFYWCIIALSNYIKVTGDLTLLNEVLPYHHDKGIANAEKTPLSEHIDRLIDMIVHSFIPGTALVPFGGGDWNDSLQPVSKELAQRMISSWTVEMNYQAFMQYQGVYEQIGQTGKANELSLICEKIKVDFNKYLIKDGVVAGYGLMEDDRRFSLLLHPGDTKTNIQYSILPMNRGIISGIFTKEQAHHHQELIEKHLKGPDGARLMNRPLKYRGGLQTLFQRAESSTFFGREIGIMYVHEHIRYAESQALTGKAEAFLKALRQANPVGYRDVVPCGDVRQANCYYSSSDVTFKNRYEADERYEEIKTGKITLKGGWRVYSSGPGIYIALIVSRLLGLRIESGHIVVDPVIPFSLDGLAASMDIMGCSATFQYTVRERCFAPIAISINGKPVEFTYEENQYRHGGAVIPTDRFLAMMNQQENLMEIKM
ncbi:MAG: amylo-alpha-1,6-glucosidase [Bacteroidota bacterium]